MKKSINIMIIGLVLSANLSTGQTYQLLNVDATRFPKVTADIAVSGAGYSPEMLTLKDICITENGLAKTPTDFRAPQSEMIPTSIALVLDVSASMEGMRFEILKQTALDFIKMLPLDITEVAIASFNQTINLACDFTHDNQRLSNALDELIPYGGTDFNNAFLTDFSGAIDIARQGMYRRVVVFITDGLSEANYEEIAKNAIRDTTFINCITVELPISEGLQYITKETGGSFYSDLSSKSDIETALKKIYSDVQAHTFGKLEWRLDYSCIPLKEIEVSLGTQKFGLSISIPDSLLGTLELSTETMSFAAGSRNVTQTKPVLIRGNNIGLNISGITNTNNSLFGFEKIKFPFCVSPNQWAPVNLTFTPRDSIYTLATYTFNQPGCPQKILEVSSQGVKKLVITNPSGGEEYSRKSSIPITWKGISKSTSVDLFYQQKGKSAWIKAVSGTRYHQNWEAPQLNDSIRIMGQVTNNLTLTNLLSMPVSIVDGSVFKSAVFNSDGTELLTQSEEGVIKTWDAETGKPNNVFEKFVAGQAAYFEKYNRVVIASKNNISLFTNRNGLLIKDISLVDKRTLASFVFIGDQEFYTSSASYSSNMWDPSLNMSISDFPGGTNLDAAFSPNGTFLVTRKKESLHVFGIKPYKKWYTVSLDPDFEKAILHATKDIIAVTYPTRTECYRLNTSKPVMVLMNQHFVQFTKSGNLFITSDSLYHRFQELETGTSLFKLLKKIPYTIHNNGSTIAYKQFDSLYVHHFYKNKTILKRSIPQLRQFRFFPASDKMVLLTTDSLLILNLETNQVEVQTICDKDVIKHMDVSPNEKSIAMTTALGVAVWPITDYFDSDTTPYFKIVAPCPVVKNQLLFPSQYVGTSSEMVFLKTIQNPNSYPIVIDSVYVSGNSQDFSLVSSASSIVIPPNGSSPVELRFSPKQSGPIEGELTIVSSPHRLTVQLLGNGLERNYVLLSPEIQFRPINIGEKVDTLFPVLCNKGNVSLSINTAMLKPIGNNAFRILSKNSVSQVKPADTLWIAIEFSAIQRGRSTSALFITVDDTEPVLATAILGTSTAKRELVIAGQTIHAITRKPIRAQVICSELNSNKTSKKQLTNLQGNFAFSVPTDLNYSLTAELKEYFSSSENVDLVTPQTVDTVWVKLELSPLGTESLIRLNNIFFESGSSDLLDISKNELNRLVDLMKQNQELSIEIQGHTDDIGSIDDNQILSKNRATAVKTYLTNNGISARRFQLTWFGELQPIASNSLPEGRKANRRVEIKLVKNRK